MAYHPGTGYAYVPVINNCAKFTSEKAFFIKGQPYWGSSLTLIDGEASGSFKAIEAASGDIKWEVQTRSPMVAGVLATAGGLVFTGDAEGFFTAYDAETGNDLWHFQCGSGHHASPITYTLDGNAIHCGVRRLGRLDCRFCRRRSALVTRCPTRQYTVCVRFAGRFLSQELMRGGAEAIFRVAMSVVWQIGTTSLGPQATNGHQPCSDTSRAGSEDAVPISSCPRRLPWPGSPSRGPAHGTANGQSSDSGKTAIDRLRRSRRDATYRSG